MKNIKFALLAGIIAIAFTACPDTTSRGGGTQAPAVVSALDLTAHVIAPVRDTEPVTTAIDAEQYTGSVAWKNNDDSAFEGSAFAANTVYKAVVTLTAKSGFTFSGVTADSFAYTGATVTNTADSGVVTIVFPATAENAALGGSLSISITSYISSVVVDIAPRVGDTLTAVTTDLTGQEGDLSYQWKAGDAAVGTNAATYTPAAGDVGKTITVTISASGNSGDISGNTAAVATAGAVPGVDLAAYLATITGATASAPQTAALSSQVLINTGDTAVTGVWATVNSETSAAQKYVALDLSACTATGNTISGTGSTPSGNLMNIIQDNTYIKGIVLPEGVTSIGNTAFSYCRSLTSVTIPSSVTTIGNGAFYYCSSLTSVTIPASVTSIGEQAFYYCTSLTSVSIPASVTSIGSNAFSFCSSLTSISVDAANANHSSEDGVLFNKAKTTLECYPAGKSATSYTIPAGVTTIGISAFVKCTGLTSVSIPSSVTSIGIQPFYSCTSLTGISVDAANANHSSEDGVLFNKAKTTLIKYPAAKNGTSYTIPASVTSIGQEAFYKCSSLASVTIPAGVTSIGQLAFYECTGLTSVTIPASVTSIGYEAFWNCTSLTSVTFVAGSNIASGSFGNNVFPEGSGSGGNALKTAYLAGGAGTYTRESNGSVWTKD